MSVSAKDVGKYAARHAQSYTGVTYATKSSALTASPRTNATSVRRRFAATAGLWKIATCVENVSALTINLSPSAQWMIVAASAAKTANPHLAAPTRVAQDSAIDT